MPSRHGQTSYLHSDINVQREFERMGRKSSSEKTTVQTGKTTPTGHSSSSQPNGAVAEQSTFVQDYSILHNGLYINTKGINRSLDFIDGTLIEGQPIDVMFDVNAIKVLENEHASVSATVFIPFKNRPTKRIIHTFDINAKFTSDAEAYSTVNEPDGYAAYMKHTYSTHLFRDIKHNYNLLNPENFVYSIFDNRSFNPKFGINCNLKVVALDANTIRVYGGYSYDIDQETVWINSASNTDMAFGDLGYWKPIVLRITLVAEFPW